MSDTESPLLTPIKQVAIVVHDLEDAVRRFSGRLGIGPWTAYRLEPPVLKDMRYQGEAAEFSLRNAFAWQGAVQFELVQPLSGPSIWRDHLDAHGEGLHHVGKYVLDFPAAVDEALAGGFTPLQSACGYGAEDDGAFAYFMPPDLPLIVELISAPRVRIEPEFVYPANC
jgi:catechol 2,3-dioxygenase-like lactoylglutathione lyase family enzyme